MINKLKELLEERGHGELINLMPELLAVVEAAQDTLPAYRTANMDRTLATTRIEIRP